MFDDGDFDEDDTFVISGSIKHTPNEVLAKNFGGPASSLRPVPDPLHLYIFPAPLPGPLASDKVPGGTPVPQSFGHRMLAQKPIRTRSGTVRITEARFSQSPPRLQPHWSRSSPAGCERAWHPNTDEWQYYIEGQAAWACSRVGQARTFDFARAMWVMCLSPWGITSRIPATRAAFLEMFKSSYYADISFDQWMAFTPPELVSAHLHTDPQFIAKLRKDKVPVVPA